MTIDLNFLLLVITIITGLCGIFAFFWKMFSEIKKDNAQTRQMMTEENAQTRQMIVEMRADFKSTKEHHNCEFNRIDKTLAEMTHELSDHEARIIKLENK